MPPAEPASVPIVSEPQPMMPFVSRYSIASAVGPGECGPFSSALRKVFGRAVALVPVGAQQHPAAGFDCAVLGFPFLDALDRQQIVRIGGSFLRAVDDVDRSDEILRRDGVGRIVRVVLAGDPVAGRVEMRAGVLAEFQPVPGPERTVLLYSEIVCTLTDGVFLPNCGGR